MNGYITRRIFSIFASLKTSSVPDLTFIKITLKSVNIKARTYSTRKSVSTSRPVDDFFDAQGCMIDYSAFRERHPAVQRFGPLRYMGWCQAIPAEWRRKITGSRLLSEAERRITSAIEIKEREILLQQVKTNFFYMQLIDDSTPTAQLKWESENVNFEDNWCRIYNMPFKVTTSTKLQSLQYRILHRYFPTRRFLCIREVVNDPFCDSCGQIESIQHFFAECNEIKAFWGDLEERINRRVNLRHRFVASTSNIIFGSLNTIDIVNFVVLNAKQFIANQRFREGQISVDIFIHSVERAFQMEKIIARKNMKMDKLLERWKPFISDISEINL